MAISKNDSKEQIERLVENFDNHINEYKKGNYNETLTRRDFIDPFLSSLGWDVDNKLNLPGSYREVIHEDKLLIDDSSRAPDYCITINGNKKFYVEAKKPSVSLKDSISAAYQLRRYGWSAKMPISIITDFEEFSIYDCQVRPNADDKASIARINYFTYQDYIKEFDFLWETFSKEMVKNGSLEKYFQSTKGKRASTSVDDEFLKSLDSWRDLLATDLVKNNPTIKEDELNFSIQKIIDRLIFLRIGEDRNIEDENQLLKSVGINTYTNLKKLFHLADRKYNSGLFDYTKDKITDTLVINDKVLKNIIEEMYYPKSPYEFSVIPVEILGHSYEQYLGKTISINSKHKIIIEEKPEVRKAGGVYYTPQYIVDYIVQNTVGKLLGDWGSGMEDRESGIADRDLGKENSFKNINEDNHESNQKLQGFESLAGINASDNTDLYNDKIISEGGNVFTDKSNEESGSISSIEYSRGERPIFKEGIYPSSINSDRIVSGTGNSDPNSIQSGISQSGNLESNNDSNSKNRSNARSVNQISKGNSLTPKPKPLTPEDVAKLKICDPACGSGSFLLGAYQYLLNWHREYYNNYFSNATSSFSLGEKKMLAQKEKYLKPDGNLTTSLKKEILLNNIFGVDIDTNAVEVTKLSLMLKAMEGETKASINYQLTAFHDRVLPTLDKNIKSGNSLIDMDFYESQIDFEPAAEKKIKPFSWEQAFPEVFKQGGFDAVIGNPPYVYIQDKNLVSYFSIAYKNQDYQSDLYLIFLERYEHLLKNKGFLGVIVSNTWLQSLTMRKIRKYLITKYNWKMFLYLKDKVFNAVVDTHVLVFENHFINDNKIQIDKLENMNIKFSHILDQNKLPNNGDVINIIAEDSKRLIFEKIKNTSNPLSNYCDVFNGVKPFEKGKGKPPQTEITMKEKPFVKEKCNKPGDDWSPLLRGSLINRYVNLWNHNSWILYGEWLAAPRKPKIFQSDTSILVRQTGDSLIATKVESGFISRNNLHIILPKSDSSINSSYILGLINSKFLNAYYEFLNPERGEALAEVKKMHVEMLPIPHNPAPEIQKQIVKLVETMLQLNKDLQASTLPEQKEQIQQRINYTDKKIDQVVYQLYDLTEEEIEVVEGE